MKFFNCIFIFELLFCSTCCEALRLEPLTYAATMKTNFKRVFLSTAVTSTAVVLNSAAGRADNSLCQCDGNCRCFLSWSERSDDQLLWYNPANERIYDTTHKSYLPPHPEKYLNSNIQGKNVITIGEVHSNPCHHKLEFDVIRTIAAKKGPENMAVGLECFYRQHQAALDRFVFGHGDIARLKIDSEWDSTWGYDLNYYAKIFKYAAKNKIRLVGLNIPIEFAKLVSEVGLSGLPSSLQKFLPEMDLGVQRHKDNFLSAIGIDGGHGMTNMPSVDRMYETQTLWDEYMSESAAMFLDANPESTLVIIAGLGHVRGRVAIPDRIYRRTKAEPFVIAPQAVKWSKFDGMPSVSAPPTRAEADWIW